MHRNYREVWGLLDISPAGPRGYKGRRERPFRDSFLSLASPPPSSLSSPATASGEFSGYGTEGKVFDFSLTLLHSFLYHLPLDFSVFFNPFPASRYFISPWPPSFWLPPSSSLPTFWDERSRSRRRTVLLTSASEALPLYVSTKKSCEGAVFKPPSKRNHDYLTSFLCCRMMPSISRAARPSTSS